MRRKASRRSSESAWQQVKKLRPSGGQRLPLVCVEMIKRSCIPSLSASTHLTMCLVSLLCEIAGHGAAFMFRNMCLVSLWCEIVRHGATCGEPPQAPASIGCVHVLSHIPGVL